MKRAFKLCLCLFVMTIMFFSVNFIVSAAAVVPDTVKVTGATTISGGYHLFTVEPSGGTHAYCLDIVKPAPTAGSTMSVFPLQQVFGAPTINKMVAVIRTSEDPNYNFGLGEADSFYVTQAALWYAENGSSPMHETLKNSSVYGPAYNRLLTAIEQANSGRDFTKENVSISVDASNGLSNAMHEIIIDGKKYLISDSDFKVTAPGNYTVSVSGGYLADSNGNNTGKTSATYSVNDTFKIIIPLENGKSGQVSASFSVSTVDVYTTGYELHGYQMMNYNSGLQRLALLFTNNEPLSASYTVGGNYDDTQKSTDIKIGKVNSKLEKVSGAELTIYDSNNSIVKSFKSTNEYITVSLNPGEYSLKETIAPKGYLLNEEVIKFSIDKDGNVKDSKNNIIEHKTLTIVDELPTIKLKKLNEKGVAVKNAKIVICSYDMDTKKESNCNFEWITDGSIKELTIGVDFGTITDGSYIIKEVEAPKGYELSEPKYVTVKDGKLYGDLDKDVVTIIDKNYLDVSKTDATGQKEIPGADMKLFDKTGKLIDKWTSTTESHRIHGLVTGEIYEIIETTAPAGYVPLETSISFVLNDDGSVTTCNIEMDSNNNKKCIPMTQDEILKIKNDVTKIKISKVDITNQQELPGATLQILKADGTPVYQDGKILEWTSTDKPHYIEMLPVGDYKLVETFSPDGYVAVSNEVKFSVKAETGIQTVVFENDVTKLLISKKDFTTEEEVPGATLQILDQSGNVVYEWVSTNEPYYIEKLPVGKYTLVETVPAPGYQEGMIIDGFVTSKYDFEVKDNVLLKIDVYNRVITDVPSTGINVSSTYVLGSMIVLLGFGTITFSKRKNEI